MLWAVPELVKTSRRDEVAELVNSKVLSRQLVKASRHGDVAELVNKVSSRCGWKLLLAELDRVNGDVLISLASEYGG